MMQIQIVPLTDFFVPALLAASGGGQSDEPDTSRRLRSRTGAAPLRAVIVEDELMIAWHIEAMLEDLGLEVCGVASHGEQAVDMCRAETPDIVVMDVNLGAGIDGVEAAARIHAEIDTSFLFVTAYSDARTLDRIEESGVGARVLTKPVSETGLAQAIGRMSQDRQT